eukprot:1753083-Alexandrium_andersonii.AAC.1
MSFNPARGCSPKPRPLSAFQSRAQLRALAHQGCELLLRRSSGLRAAFRSCARSRVGESRPGDLGRGGP